MCDLALDRTRFDVLNRRGKNAFRLCWIRLSEMGQKHSMGGGTAGWSADDWAFGTGANALSAEEVIAETSKLPAKLFGGAVIEKDPSMHRIQSDLLNFDDSLKGMFRGKKKKQKKSNGQAQDDYQQEYYPPSQQGHQDYLQPVPFDQNQMNPSAAAYPPMQSSQRLTWRCTGCTTENKTTERYCRRCGQVETSL